MTQEDYCSYEVAKLLKEKGFDGECIGCYWDSKKTFDINYEPLSYSDGDLRDEVIIAPTHQMAMKWLREVHKISIEIYCIPSYTKGLVVWRYMIRNCETCDKVDYPNGYPTQECLMFEEAVEAAIKYSLENLI